MKHLREIIKENGYESYRYGVTFKDQNSLCKKYYNDLFKSNKEIIFEEGDRNTERSYFYFKDNRTVEFSTMMPSGLDIIYLKNKDLKNKIVWGLGFVKYGSPPTLIQPRPKIRVKKYFEYKGEKRIKIMDETDDDAMNICLQKENHQKIFDAITGKKDIIFEYDFTI